MALPNGKKLKYILSGHLQFWLTIIFMGHAIPLITETAPNSQVYVIQGFSPLKLSLLYDNYVQLISVSTVGAFALSFYLYFSSFTGKDQILAKGGNTGNAIYDFFIGMHIYLLTVFLSFFLLFICLYVQSFYLIFLPSFFPSFLSFFLPSFFSSFIPTVLPLTSYHALSDPLSFYLYYR